MRTATRSSARSPDSLSDARASTTTSGRGAIACTVWRYASRREQLRAIATHLYVELLRGGYTQVCEFHYLQHASDGNAYEDRMALSIALADAAADAGIGLTLLPVLYERAGFALPTPRDEQRRFVTSPDGVWAMRTELATSGRPLVNAGIAIHSLRAASPASIVRLRALADGSDGPIHIHVAEQIARGRGVPRRYWCAPDRMARA